MLETIVLSIVMIPMLLLIAGAGLMMIVCFWTDVDDVVSIGPVSAVISRIGFVIMCIAWVTILIAMAVCFF